MKKNPFLLRFKSLDKRPVDDSSSMDEQYFSLDENINTMRDGTIMWSARYRRPPTSCYTAPRYIKAGYTRSGKYKSGRWSKSRTDRRAGK